MDASTVNLWLMIGTLLTAFGTLALAAIAGIAAKVALRELRNTSKQIETANGQLKLTAEQAALATEQLEYSKNLAEKTVSRQRAELTHTAIRRFSKIFDQKNPVMLTAARKITKDREQNRNGQRVLRCQIPDLFTREMIIEDATPEEALDALQSCLDCLEELAVGVELGVYDDMVVFHNAHNVIRRLVEWAKPFIKLLHEGGIRQRIKQPTAYSMLLRLDARLAEIGKEGAPTKLAGALED